MKHRLLQRRIKAEKSCACGMCKPWKRGGEDKRKFSEYKKALSAVEQLNDAY